MEELDFSRKLLELGDKEGAIKELVRLLRNNPRNIDAWLLLANALDDPSKKADCYRQILRIDPDNQYAQEQLHAAVSSFLINSDKSGNLAQNTKTEDESSPKITRKEKTSSKRKYWGMTKKEIMILGIMSLGFCLVLISMCLLVNQSFLPSYISKIIPTFTLVPTKIPLSIGTLPPTNTPRPTYTLIPTNTSTPIPTSTPIIYLGDAKSYVLSQSEVPVGLEVNPAASGRYKPDIYTYGLLSSYSFSYRGPKVDLLSIDQNTVWALLNVCEVYNSIENAKPEFEYWANNTTLTNPGTLNQVSRIDVPTADVAELLIGVSRNINGVNLTEARIVFRKANIVCLVISYGGLKSADSLEAAFGYRINEVKYFTSLVVDKIK